MASILIVEDEKAINDLIAINLRMIGHRVFQALNGEAAAKSRAEQELDLLILDVMLPDTDGFTLYEKLKPVPAIFVTALGDAYDKVRGFSLGADDYIVKPFEITELLMRVRAVLRRTKKTAESYTLGDLKVDFTARTVYLRGEEIELTLQEFTLLATLIENRNIALSRQKLLKEAWGISFFGESRTVDVHVQKLRKKLELEDRIKTVYKVGYRFEDPT